MKLPIAAALLAASAFFQPAPAQAQFMVPTPDGGRKADLSERQREAVPLPLPRATGPVNPRALPFPQKSVVFPGGQPSAETLPADPGASVPAPASESFPASRSKGTSGYPFTAGRVFPDAAVTTAPYRMAGKVLFRDPATNSWYMCTGAVISYRLVLTAGHCVYNASRKSYYADWRFIPAYNGTVSTQPYGTWFVSAAGAAAGWTAGNGSVPNVSDFALLEIADQTIGGVPKRIGDIVGWFAVATNRLVGAHVSAIGYPGNIDGGARMIVNSGETRSYGSTSGVVGSAMGGGASGGPWVEDFGVLGSGQLVANSSPNQIVGVTSYGPSGGPSPSFFLGSSILNTDFVNLRNGACARRIGNC